MLKKLHDQGLLSVFDDAEATKVIKLIDRVMEMRWWQEILDKMQSKNLRQLRCKRK